MKVSVSLMDLGQNIPHTEHGRYDMVESFMRLQEMLATSLLRAYPLAAVTFTKTSTSMKMAMEIDGPDDAVTIDTVLKIVGDISRSTDWIAKATYTHIWRPRTDD